MIQYDKSGKQVMHNAVSWFRWVLRGDWIQISVLNLVQTSHFDWFLQPSFGQHSNNENGLDFTLPVLFSFFDDPVRLVVSNTELEIWDWEFKSGPNICVIYINDYTPVIDIMFIYVNIYIQKSVVQSTWH